MGGRRSSTDLEHDPLVWEHLDSGAEIQGGLGAERDPFEDVSMRRWRPDLEHQGAVADRQVELEERAAGRLSSGQVCDSRGDLRLWIKGQVNLAGVHPPDTGNGGPEEIIEVGHPQRLLCSRERAGVGHPRCGQVELVARHGVAASPTPSRRRPANHQRNAATATSCVAMDRQMYCIAHHSTDQTSGVPLHDQLSFLPFLR